MKRRNTKARTEWVKWLEGYGVDKFYDAFLRTAQGAEGKCRQCGEDIFLDIVEGGGVPDWRTADGDYGCPESCEDGTGSHEPHRLVF